MNSSRWMLPTVAVVALLAAGCGGGQPSGDPPANAAPGASAGGSPAAAPASGPVSEVPASCGVQGVYWQGAWWAVDLPIQTVRDQTPTRTLSGTMSTTTDGHARLDSPDLLAPQTLYRTPNTNPNAPPFVMCSPLVS